MKKNGYPEAKQEAPLPPPAPMEQFQVHEYIRPYGYVDRPVLVYSLNDHGHREIAGHTYYEIECRLSGVCELSWKAERRLEDLRKGLHDFIKKEAKDDYRSIFGGDRFPHHGGMPGTTDRLRKWLDKLATSVNKGTAPPAVVAHALFFFNAPPPIALQAQGQQFEDIVSMPEGAASNMEFEPKDPEMLESHSSSGGESC